MSCSFHLRLFLAGLIATALVQAAPLIDESSLIPVIFVTHRDAGKRGGLSGMRINLGLDGGDLATDSRNTDGDLPTVLLSQEGNDGSRNAMRIELDRGDLATDSRNSDGGFSTVVLRSDVDGSDIDGVNYGDIQSVDLNDDDVDSAPISQRIIGQIGVNTGDLTSNNFGSAPSQSSIGQIGIDAGTRTENNFIPSGSPAATNKKPQTVSTLSQILSFLQGKQQTTADLEVADAMVSLEDIGQIGINNGQVSEYNFGSKNRKGGAPAAVAGPPSSFPSAETGSNEEHGLAPARPLREGRPEQTGQRAVSTDRLGGEHRRERERPREVKRSWKQEGGRRAEFYRPRLDLLSDGQDDIGQIAVNNGPITEYNGVKYFRRRRYDVPVTADDASIGALLADIGQIGINNGQITEYHGIRGGGRRHHFRRYHDEDVDDIGQIGINNGYITEYNNARPHRFHRI